MFDNTPWYFWLLPMLVGAAILGFLIGQYFRRNKWQANIDSLNKRDKELNAALDACREEKRGLNNKIVQITADLGEASANLEQSQAQYKVCQMTVEGQEGKLAALEGKIGELEGENKRLNQEILLLQQELDDLSASASTRGIGGNIAMGSGAPAVDQDVILAEIKANAGKIPTEDLGIALDNSRDNLLKINNITPWQEAKLNAAGINSYLQIARMQDEEAAIIADVAQLDAETIKTDDWKGQARELLGIIAATVPKDSLRKIEGIGPKIEGLCYNNGIYTFHDLAKTSVSVLKHILKEGGSRFRMHNPGTWPKQAEMAAKGDWEELKKWQDILDGGV